MAQVTPTLSDRCEDALDSVFILLLSGPAPARVPAVHVRFVLDALHTPAWVASCVRRTASIPNVRVSLEVTGSAANGSAVWRRWSARSLAFATLRPDEFPAANAASRPDVVINCSSRNVPGAWFFAVDDHAVSPDLRELFLHACDRPRAIELRLSDGRHELAALHASPWDGMDWARHAQTIEAAPVLVLVALLGRGAIRTARPAAPADCPSPLHIASFTARKTARSLMARVTSSDFAADWKIAIRDERLRSFGNVPDTGWRWTSGFKGHQAADPFLVDDGLRHWLFYEDVVPPGGKGRLAVMPALDSNAEPRVILEKPYHLSYPFVFRHAGEWWMIPESGANQTVDLYRAREFPYNWVHERTLMQGHRLADTTPFWHDGLWYFFASAWLPGRAQAGYLFFAESLTSPWRIHPSSPLTLDPAEARGAGPIFEQDGHLYRPVQDCLAKYGYAVRFREILELTPDACREHAVSTLLPDWHPGLDATHTFCQSSGACVIDGQVRA